MKWIAALVPLFLFVGESYGQRRFTLVDASHRDVLIYMNDSTGKYVDIPIENLTLGRSRIVQVTCGDREAIRTNLLRNGIAVLIDFAAATVGDQQAQKSAYRNKLGLWNSASNRVERNITQSNKKFNTLRKDTGEVIHPNFVTKNSAGTVSSQPKLPIPKLSDEPVKLSTLKDQRIFVYRFTKENQLWFRKLVNGILTKTALGISTENMSVDYDRIDTIYCGHDQTIKKVIVQIGAAGLDYPNKETEPGVRKALYFAQSNKIGVWRNFDPAKLKPVITKSDPPATEDPDVAPLTNWGKVRLFCSRVYHKTIGRLGPLQWITVLSVLVNIVLSVLQIRAYLSNRRGAPNPI